MKKPSRSYLILSLMAVAMMTSRCDCGRGSTSSGRCEGAIGSLLISDEIDATSHYAIDHDRGLNLIDASFGSGKLRFSAEVTRATVLTGGEVLNLPVEVASGGGTGGADGGTGGTDGGTGVVRPASPEIKSWTLVAPASRPKLRDGTLDRVLTFVDLRLSTTLRLIFEDGTSVLCEFHLRHDEEQDIGKDPSESGGGGCGGGGGGGDSDFD
ncbi:MAG TPA: hypothetical protein VNA24_19360 [Hyalangium sp.]|nr:hypothetical protein [Hyalangium sp.]